MGRKHRTHKEDKEHQSKSKTKQVVQMQSHESSQLDSSVKRRFKQNNKLEPIVVIPD